MLKVSTSLFGLVCMCVSFGLFGNEFNGPTNLSTKVFDNLTIKGPARLKLIKAQTLEVRGPLDFHSLDITGDAYLYGPVTGEKGKFGHLNVTGKVEVEEVICDNLTVKGTLRASSLIVNGHSEVFGLLNLKHSILKTLTVKSTDMTLDEVLLESIVVSKENEEQILVLKGETKISGDIVFESGIGIIDIQSPEVRIEGSIIGARKTEKSPE